MGVPKFFRWMSERYPAISQLIAENRIPEFDCLYLDMNGIIHNCTHKDSDSPTFRMTEDKMFIQIFNYIEHLFSKIQPRQLFFMAIDGVAPRAKMNQQRARRFRTALDAELAKEKAIREGVDMPSEDAFDSNCITPGTEFMAKLTKQLKYFINKKISEDVDWQGVEIVLSGHEVPGEGEHKIMEYIRLAKAQPQYNANLRHCLYGLDADLIMLGLLSHDPHFCLLREEVTFGRQSQKKSKELEHQNFYLMHLCIVREYLELEFQELRQPGILNFPYDMERVIDDFILMAFFVGNDFLPNLPNLHINEGALALMFKIYKSVLPKAGGYINELGVINLERLAMLLDDLSEVEFRFFESEHSDANWLRAKQLERNGVPEAGAQKGEMVMSSNQKMIFKQVKQYVSNGYGNSNGAQQPLDLSSSLKAQDRKFVETLANDLHLNWQTVDDATGQRHLRLSLPQRSPDDDETEDETEAQIALSRVLKRYDKAKVVDTSPQDAQEQAKRKYEEKFRGWKDKYYRSKFEWGLDSDEEMRQLTENYVQGLQWVLFYYYRGVASWPWFYRYHYSPMISDVKKGLRANMNFELGQPFRPYQQLMGVLPDRSKKIVPTPYHDLMTNPNSPIIDFYPRNFDLDMNGKKMEWEAVVKIPFIDERRLLDAMRSKDLLLSQDQKDRNDFGVTLKFSHSDDVDFTYPSSLVGVFPDLPHCHCVENIFDLPTIEGLDIHVGLVDGAKLGDQALAGFPSLKTLAHTGTLGFHGVSVFQQDSKNESMVITLSDSDKSTKVEAAKAKLCQRVHIGYPFLSEAKVMSVSDEMFSYHLPPNGIGPPIAVPHGPKEIEIWHKKAERIESNYSKRLGMMIGQVESLVHVDMLKGLRKNDDGASVKEYAQIPGVETDYAAQVVVEEVNNEDPRFLEKPALPIEEEFAVGTRAFFLGEFAYGRPLEVLGHKANKADIWVSTTTGKTVEFGHQIVQAAEQSTPYTPSFAVARMLGLNPLVLSKITASFSIMLEGTRVNLGLNLKFEAKKLKVLGYSRRGPTGWEFSQKAIELVQQYMLRFPDFIAGIQRNPQGDLYPATAFYPESEATAKVKEIQSWLKSIESKSFEKVPLEAAHLDSEVVHKIEAMADEALETNPPSNAKAKKIGGVPRNALLRPADAENRLSHQQHALGDRVVYVQESGRVPIATQGTVVGITRTSRTTLLDVVFDATFMSGTSLAERCSPFRGSTVPLHSVLNLSNRQVIVGSRAAENHRVQPEPSSFTAYGAPLGPKGQGQLVPAQPPAPLGGSFRGAVASGPGSNQGGTRTSGNVGAALRGNFQPQGHNLPIRSNGHQESSSQRGRGGRVNGFGSRGQPYAGFPGVNRNGYIQINAEIDQGMVQENPTFKPQAYPNVPPPASLENRGRGRGRGAPRGTSYRGGRSRGQVAIPVQPS